MFRSSVVVAFLLSCFASIEARAEMIRLFDYHHQPPFSVLQDIPDLPGMTQEFATLLMADAPDGQHFKPIILPRVRLNRDLADWIAGKCPAAGEPCQDDWIVLWVAPEWGWGADAVSRYRWVDLYRDENALLSRPGVMIDPLRPETFIGKTIAATRGHALPPVLAQLVDQGLLTRQDGEGTHALLKRVVSERADFTYIQRSSIEFARKHRADIVKELEKVTQIEAPLSTYMLKAMIPPTRPDLEARVREIVDSPAWPAMLKRYGVQK